jgi:glycosyltransferase involved in cell wall biosynthesis
MQSLPVTAPPPPEKALRVAMLSPIAWRTPPHHYGPWELMTSLLTEGLVRRGVDVTLFATADSQTAGRLVSVSPKGYAEDASLDAKVWECLHISEVFERARAGEFDLIHNQFDFLPLSYSGLVDVPMVTTIHGFSSQRILPVYEKYNPRCAYVAISDADRSPRLSYAATIHHGIDMSRFRLRAGASGDYLLFFGRIHPDKGAAEALDLAEAAGWPLQMAGIIQDEGYFNERIAPRLDGKKNVYLGPVGPERRQTVLESAAALLHLINFDEPFGLSVVESMACGTPVIARPRGSMRELISPGVNGFLVDSPDEGRRAVEQAAALDRAEVRASVEVRFGVERMVDEYLALYRRLVGGGIPSGLAPATEKE